MKPLYLVPFSRMALFGLGLREECLSRGGHVLSTVTDLLEREPDMRFLALGLTAIESFLACRPERHEALSLLVTQGRLELGAEWAALPQSVVEGEALVRNLLQGQGYLKRCFGVRGKTAFLPGQGGGVAQFPQIARACEVDRAAAEGILWSGASLRSWDGLGGGRLLVLNGSRADGCLWDGLTRRPKGGDRKALSRTLQESAATGGVSPWGGALTAPSAELCGRLSAVCEEEGVVPTFLTPAMVRAADPSILTLVELPSAWPLMEPTLPGLFLLGGRATRRLMDAERLAAIAHLLTGFRVPPGRLGETWRGVLEALSADWGGTGSVESDGDRERSLLAAEWQAEGVIRGATRAVAERVKTNACSSLDFSIVVFNPTSWRRTDVVVAHVSFYGSESPGEVPFDRYRLVDARGENVPFQDISLQRLATTETTLAFVAEDVPPDGYAAYTVAPATEASAGLLRVEAPGMVSPAQPEPSFVMEDVRSSISAPYRGIRTGRTFSAAFYDLAVDEVTGKVSIRDRRLGRSVAEGIRILGVEEGLDRGPTAFSPTGRVFETAVSEVVLEEDGEVRATLRIEGKLLSSDVTLRFTLYRLLDRIDLEARVKWRSQQAVRVQLVVETGIPSPAVRHGVAFGWRGIEPGNPAHGQAMSGMQRGEGAGGFQGWISLDAEAWGIVAASDRGAFDLLGGELRVDMLRSIPADSAQDYRMVWRTYPEEVVSRFGLRSYPGDFRSARVWKDGWGLVHPLVSRTVSDPTSPRVLPAHMSACEVDPMGDVIVSAIKPAEDGDGVILRAFDATGEGREGNVKVSEAVREVVEANGLEEEVSGGEAPPLSPRFRPFEIRTFRLRTDPDRRQEEI